MPWTKISFSRADVDAGKPQRVVEAISMAYVARPSPAEPVLFRTTGLNGINDYFISPEASGLAIQALSAAGAKECPPPETASLVPVLLPLKKHS